MTLLDEPTGNGHDTDPSPAPDYETERQDSLVETIAIKLEVISSHTDRIDNELVRLSQEVRLARSEIHAVAEGVHAVKGTLSEILAILKP